MAEEATISNVGIASEEKDVTINDYVDVESYSKQKSLTTTKAGKKELPPRKGVVMGLTVEIFTSFKTKLSDGGWVDSIDRKLLFKK